MDFNEIGQQICKARKFKKITQEKLASQLGMSRATISGIENGTVNEIGIRKIILICLALGLEIIIREKSQRPTLEQLVREQSNA